MSKREREIKRERDRAKREGERGRELERQGGRK